MKRKVIFFSVLIVLVFLGLRLIGVLAVNPFCRNRMEKPEGALRVMTFNMNALEGDGYVPFSKDSLLSVLMQVEPDVLCLQELSPKLYDTISDVLDSVFRYTEPFGRYNVICSRLPLSNPGRYRAYGDVDTTGYSNSDHLTLKDVKGSMPVCSADVTCLDGSVITVLGCHLSSCGYSSIRRAMAEDASWFSGVPEYAREYGIARRLRAFEADNLRPVLDSLLQLPGTASGSGAAPGSGVDAGTASGGTSGAGSRRVIIAGDFNDFSRSYCLRRIQGDDLTDAWSARGNGFGFTYDGWHLRLRLDHILYSPGLTPRNVIVLDTCLSDHRALIADFAL